MMNNQLRHKITGGIALSLVTFASLGVTAHAQEVTIQGLVTGRNAESMSVKTGDSPRQTVILSDTTKATEKGGFLA